MICTLHQIEKNEMDGACNTYGGWQRCVQDFGGKPEGKRPFARPRCRWENNIKMDLSGSGM